MSMKKNLFKTLRKLQLFFLILALPPLYEIIQAWGSTTSCLSYDLSYKILIFAIFLTGIISLIIYKKFKNPKDYLIYVPLVFLLIFIFQYVTYRFDYIQIYEQFVGGNKTYDSFADEGKFCDRALIRLLKK